MLTNNRNKNHQQSTNSIKFHLNFTHILFEFKVYFCLLYKSMLCDGIHVQWALPNYSFLFQLVRLCKQYGRCSVHSMVKWVYIFCEYMCVMFHVLCICIVHSNIKVVTNVYKYVLCIYYICIKIQYSWDIIMW